MLGVCLIVVALSANGALGNISTEAGMPIQEFPWSDENMKNIFRENNEIKSSIEVLKIRLELQQSLHEQQITKLENLINKTSRDTQEIQKSFNKDLLNVLKSIDSKLEDKSKKGNETQKFSNCAETLMKNQGNGIYNMTLRNYREPFPVYCDNTMLTGMWTVIQRRQDGSVDFFHDWNEYKNGFGDLNGEFFIGLDKLSALTAESPQELLIEIKDCNNRIRYEKYDAFAIGDEIEDYKLKVLGSYSGNAGGFLTYLKGMKFSTKDRDNDNAWSGNCAKDDKGGWWYDKCHQSNLNGMYNNTVYKMASKENHWRGFECSLKWVQMLIRPKIS